MTKKGKTQQPPPPREPQKLISKSTPQDVTSIRAKGSGHGKKTADKWNQ
jgi:hypothetical protein